LIIKTTDGAAAIGALSVVFGAVPGHSPIDSCIQIMEGIA